MRLRLTHPTGKSAIPVFALAVLLTFSHLDAAHSQDGANAVCVSAANREIGSVYHTTALPGGSVLVSAEKGLYLARARDGQVALTRATGAELAPVTATHAVAGGTLIGALNGLFLGRDASGAINVTAVPSDTEAVFALHGLPGAGVLVGGANGTFLAKGAAAGVTVTRVEGDTGRVFEMMPFSKDAVLIAAEKGLFIARNTNGKVSLAPAGKADIGYARATRDLPGIGLRIEASRWFLAREQAGTVSVDQFGDATTGHVNSVGDLPSGRMLLHTEKGWFLGDSAGGKLAFTPVSGPDAPKVDRMITVRDGLLFSTAPGWFVAREKDGKVTFTKAGAFETTNMAFHFHELPGGAVLIGAFKGLFVIRPSEADPRLTKIEGPDTGYIFMMRELTGRRLLVGARQDFFIAHEENGKIRLVPVGSGDTDTGRLVDVPRYPGFLAHDLPDGTVLFGSQKGLMAAVPKPCPKR